MKQTPNPTQQCSYSRQLYNNPPPQNHPPPPGPVGYPNPEPSNQLVTHITYVQQPDPQGNVILSGSQSQANQDYPAQKHLSRLAYLQLVLSIIIFLFGCGSVHNSAHGNGGSLGCYIATGIWSGILSITAAAFGVASVRRPWKQCLLITWFVLSIIVTCSSGLLFIFSTMWAGDAGGRLSRIEFDKHYKEKTKYGMYYNYRDSSEEYKTVPHRTYDYYTLEKDNLKTSLALNLLLVFLALTHMVCCIVSSSLSCYRWKKRGCCDCCDSAEPQPVTTRVVYIANAPSAPQGMLNQQQAGVSAPPHQAQPSAPRHPSVPQLHDFGSPSVPQQHDFGSPPPPYESIAGAR